MKKIHLLIAMIIISNGINSQIIDNNLQGYYQAKSDSNMYSFFEFDGNGKVNITGIGTGDYFIKGDSLIIYPDKSIFKFKIKNNTLVGTSSWVENETWIKKNTVVTNKRKEDGSSQKLALLLYEYYNSFGEKSSFDFVFDNENSKTKNKKINELCNQGLSKACLDYFGILLIADQGLGSFLNSDEKTKPKDENSEIIALGNKIIAQGDPEGYTVLGAYFYVLGNKEKAVQLWNLGMEKGSQKSAVALMQIEEE
jgi:hypothetical protein